MKLLFIIFILCFPFITFSFNDICKNKDAIIIGDIHGDLSILLSILRNSNIIKENGDWNTDSSMCVIQVGDIIDRGPYSLESYFYLKSLQKQSKGQFILLIGNHELVVLENAENHAYFLTGADDWINKYEFNFFRNILKEDLKNGTIQASHFLGDNNRVFAKI